MKGGSIFPYGVGGTAAPDYLARPSLTGHACGTLRWDAPKNRYELAGDPALMAFARRLFPGANVGRERLFFSAHPREVGDLNWLLLRYPVDVTECADRLEEARAAAVTRWQRRTSGDDLRPTVPPPTFRGTLYPYQQEAVTFLVSNRRCLLGDGMGLGKTWAALGAVASSDRWPVLVVCQPHVLRQWQRVIGAVSAQQGAGQLALMGDSDAQGRSLAPILVGLTPHAIPDTPYTLIHYGLLAKWESTLRDRGYPVVIYDEVQELRHTGTAKYSAASLLSGAAEYCWGLSGTPIYGYGIEIWSVLNAIDFHCLGSQDAFSREWCTGYGERMVKDPQALHGYLAREGLLLRRRASDVAVQLPRVARAVQDLAHDEALYAALTAGARIKAQTYIKTPHGDLSWHTRGQLLRDIEQATRRACGMAKATAAAAAVRALVDRGERPLVYAWHHDVHDVLRDHLADFHPALFTGRETTAQKDAHLRRFQRGQTPVAVLSLRSAAGLDGLQQRATCCVFVELDWSPAVHMQAECRIARMGVPDAVRDVPSWYLVSRTGFDEIVMDVLGIKNQQSVGILGDEPEDQAEAEAIAKQQTKRLKDLALGLAQEEQYDETVGGGWEAQTPATHTGL